MNKVSCNMMGGLGNVLFQMFTTISYGIKYNKEPIFSFINYNPVHSNIKDYEFIFNNINFINNKLFINNVYNELPNFQYQEIPNIEGDLLLVGYFQSEKYFTNINPLDFFNKDFINETKDTYHFLLDKPTISIHVRRGDYTKLQDFHPLQEIEYYFKGIEIIKEKTNKEYRILVFSDDLEYVKEKFNTPEFVFVNAKDYHSLFIMSFCEHNIMSNSTFSWWGSFLNENPNKIIVTPKKWFGNKYDFMEKSNIYIKNSIII